MPFIAPPSPAGLSETILALIAYCQTIEANIPGGVSGANILTPGGDIQLTAAQSGAWVKNTGASGAQNYFLPPATPGADFSAYVDAAQTINFDATGTDVIKNGGLTSIAGGKISSATLGNFVRLHCFVAGVWIATAIVGDWDLQTS